MAQAKTVAVVGAGIVGVSTAIWLQRAGHEVILIDRAGPAEGTSHGNGGVLASCAIVPVTGPGLLRKAPRMLFDPRAPLFLKWGYLPRLAPWLMRYLRHANAPDTARIAAALAPLIGNSLGFAVKMPDHGRIADPGRYVKDLAAHAQAQGARLIIAEVQDVVRENGTVTGLRAGGETIPCDAVVIATGAWSRQLAATLGVTVPLESERGYHLELWEPSAMPRSPVMITQGKFVATPMEGRLRLAGILEFGGLQAPASAAPFELLRRNLRAAFPGLRWEREVEWMGHRPAPSDSIPLIGPVPGFDGAWLGFGHHHVGLTGGPRTGQLLAQMVSGAKPNIDLTPYSPSRFAA